MAEKPKWVVVIDLETGGQTLQKGSRKSAEEIKKPIPISRWWDQTGSKAFLYAAEGWKQNKAADFAGEFGHDVENGGPLMNAAETEESLRRAFGTARRSGIPSLDVVRIMKSATLKYMERLGENADWLPEFTASAVGLLSEVYGLGSGRTKALKKYQFTDP